MRAMHLVLGSGPVGTGIASRLFESGTPVTVVNRSGTRPPLLPAGVPLIKADVTRPGHAAEKLAPAVVYQALNPRYHAWHRDFPALQQAALRIARDSEAVYVSIENLYMYDASAPVTEAAPEQPVSAKGRLRLNMAREVHDAFQTYGLRTIQLRSSDYFGPGVLGSAFGERVFGALARGRKASLTGRSDRLHSFAYVPDVAAAAVELALKPDAWGGIWLAPHAPALTQAGWLSLAGAALGRSPAFNTVNTLMRRLAGLVIPEARASVEMMYAFNRPFVADSSRIARTFGLHPTPAAAAVDATMRWFLKQFGREAGGPA